jgi:DMSO reductase anchor subunit
MTRALGLWTVGWLLIGVVVLVLGVVNGAPGGILALAALSDVVIIVLGIVVIVFVRSSSRVVDWLSERTLSVAWIVVLVGGAVAAILLPGLRLLALLVFGLFALGFVATRLPLAAGAGRLRDEPRDEQADPRDAQRDAVFASLAARSRDSVTGEARGDEETTQR